MRRKIVLAAALTAVLAVYVVAMGGRVVALLGTGEPVGVVLGIAFAVLPVIVIWFILREWRLAIEVQRMADALAAEGALPVDDLPRSPGGRIDRAAADTAFGAARERAQAEPDSWRAWYHVAFAYDASGDRRRARESLRQAARLHRGG